MGGAAVLLEQSMELDPGNWPYFKIEFKLESWLLSPFFINFFSFSAQQERTHCKEKIKHSNQARGIPNLSTPFTRLKFSM
jgi:hypothetical protein